MSAATTSHGNHGNHGDGPMRDPLTGLPTRLVLLDRLEHALARHTRLGTGVAVLVLDIDEFRSINAGLGRVAGDQILAGVAERVVRCVRAADTVTRSGGDELTIVLEDIASGATSYDVGARVLAALADPFTVAGRSVVVSASLGIAIAAPGDTAAGLVDQAALAMGRAERGADGHYRVYEAGMRAAVQERVELKADLTRAVTGDDANAELVPYYQPIVDLEDGRLVAVEALVRWQHPTRGLLTPDAFLGMAEETGLVHLLGSRMLSTACADAAARWPADVRVAVNVSAAELQGGQLVARVERALADAGLPAERLTLEITERSMIGDLASATATLAALACLGVGLSLDDFGTGHASLTYLARFPVSQLKIDRSFTDRIDGGPGRRLVGATIGLSNALGLEVVAEGVETPDQVQRLLDLGCRFGQGFHLGRPRPAAALLGPMAGMR
jgi:diguanylate cyclase (GGDEF)-like protein